jgi:hypothetical protein
MKSHLSFLVITLLLICLVRLLTRSVDYYSRPKLGFIITRHIKDRLTSRYWFLSYQSIRKFYPHVPIVVIDDNSNPKFVDPDLENNLDNCRILQSEYPKRGEMLAYYYFLQNHWFDKAVIIHDSVFVRQKVDLENCKNIKFLWHFESDERFDDRYFETMFLHSMGGPYLELYANKKEYWKGCFGLMAVIEHSFLKKIAYLFVLRDDIKSRRHRSCMERIFAVMCFHHYPELMRDCSFFGDIQEGYPRKWGYSLEEYETDQENNHTNDLPPFVKVWTGR